MYTRKNGGVGVEMVDEVKLIGDLQMKTDELILRSRSNSLDIDFGV